jgi:hypothetical protein
VYERVRSNWPLRHDIETIRVDPIRPARELEAGQPLTGCAKGPPDQAPKRLIDCGETPTCLNPDETDVVARLVRFDGRRLKGQIR